MFGRKKRPDPAVPPESDDGAPERPGRRDERIRAITVGHDRTRASLIEGRVREAGFEVRLLLMDDAASVIGAGPTAEHQLLVRDQDHDAVIDLLSAARRRRTRGSG